MKPTRQTVAVIAVVLGAACSGTGPVTPDPVDRTVALEGAFCTPVTQELARPLKILVAMDASPSMSVVDPSGARAQALVDLLGSLPQEPDVSFSVLAFAGSTSAFLTRSGLAEFEPVTSLSPADRLSLRDRVLNMNGQGTDATDFIRPLSDIHEFISREIAKDHAGGSQTKAYYSVIFVSDGHPSYNQDVELLCGDSVRRIRQLKAFAGDVRVSAAHLFLPTLPSTGCSPDAGPTPPSCILPVLPAGTCASQLINQNAERLRRMSEIGGGAFRDIRAAPVDFGNLGFATLERKWVLDRVLVTNLSSAAGSPLESADSDSDGLLDDAELAAGTLPSVSDTDGDGLSDGVEVSLARRGSSLSPTRTDPGCATAARGMDSDCDGLADCDEQLLGSDEKRADTDSDGMPDALEWQLGTQLTVRDADADPDNDQVTNGDELAAHTNPLEADRAEAGYHTELQSEGVKSDGRRCFSFRVDNVALAKTQARGGRSAGYNDLMVSVSMRPEGDPAGRTLVKLFRDRDARFPVDGVTSPVGGVVSVNLEQTCR